MKKVIAMAAAFSAFLVAVPLRAQVKMTREQVLFYTSEWKGDRFPDGRPRLPDALLKRAVDMTIEDVWEYLRDHGISAAQGYLFTPPLPGPSFIKLARAIAPLPSGGGAKEVAPAPDGVAATKEKLAAA